MATVERRAIEGNMLQSDARFEWRQPDELVPWPGLNPRSHFDAAKHTELVESVRRDGVLEPLLVHENPERPDWVVAGERRLRAASEAGVQVPCIVRRYTEGEALRVALLENLIRSNLTPIEEARGFARLLQLPDMSQKKLAERIGASQPYISNRIRLLELPEDVLDLVETGTLDASAARDYLLPFAKIPEKVRAKLYGAIAKALNQALRHGELYGDDIEDIVVENAKELSLPVDPGTAQYNEEQPAFSPKEHESCGCNGPAFKYGYGERKGVRCFDEKWWKAAHAAAREREAAKAKRAAERAEKAGAAAEAATRMSEDAFRKSFGDVYRMRIDNELLDAAELADAQLVVVTQRYGDDYVCCTDAKALRRAKGIVTKAERELLAEKRAERGRKLRADAEKAKLEPWMLSTILEKRPHRDSVLDIGRELDLEVKGANIDQLAALKPPEVELLFKALALRYQSSGEYFHDKLPQQVRETIRKRYAPGVAALVRKAKAAAKKEAAEPELVRA